MTPISNRLTPTTRSIDDLYQLYREGRLDIQPDYQRNSVWPPKARAYLVDTVLVDLPIPMLFLFRYHDSNSNRLRYRVIDGQQRLRAVFAYLENRFRATESTDFRWARKTFARLGPDEQAAFMSYSFMVMEMTGFSEPELRDVFARINRYVVRLNAQELIDAEAPGAFKDYVDRVASDPIWGALSLFTHSQSARKRDKEYIAELTVLMLEGPQDKKGPVGLYYHAGNEQFDEESEISARLLRTATTAFMLIGGERTSLHKLPSFYGLMGALFNLLSESSDVERASLELSQEVKDALKGLRDRMETLPDDPTTLAQLIEADSEAWLAAQLRTATSRQTDNIRPRNLAIEVFETVIRNAWKAEDGNA